MPNVVYAAKAHEPTLERPHGVLVYARTAQGNDALAWLDAEGKSVTQSQLKILENAACEPNTPNAPRNPAHHDLVGKGVELIAEDEKTVGGQLGRPSGARFKTYERLKRHAERTKGSLFENQTLYTVIDEIYRYPLLSNAEVTLKRQLKSGISDEDLEQLVFGLREDDRLCAIQEDLESKEPEIICSMGLV
jgi:hypothetical protein